MVLGIQVHLLISWHEYVQKCSEVHASVTQMVYKLTKVYRNDTCHCCAQGCLSLAYYNVHT